MMMDMTGNAAENTESNLVIHARREMEMAELNAPDADYNGEIYNAVLKLITVFANQGHSGTSAAMTIDLFERLASYETLLPITSNPDEWILVQHGTDPLWQSRRNPSTFSKDGGATWYNLDDLETANLHLSATQKRIVELDKRKPEIKKFYEDYSAAVEALILEHGVENYFQDDEGTVYKSHFLDGKFVKFELHGVKRTRKPEEAASSTNLSMKEAKENGFDVGK